MFFFLSVDNLCTESGPITRGEIAQLQVGLKTSYFERETSRGFRSMNEVRKKKLTVFQEVKVIFKSFCLVLLKAAWVAMLVFVYTI